MKIKVLFLRNFNGFFRYTGGHQKLYDYFEHFLLHKEFEVTIAMSNKTLWNRTNPWQGHYKQIIPMKRVEITDYDLLFLEGTDWMDIEKGAEEKIPVINLIQAVRHADPENIRYQFLKRKAIRIAISKEVTFAIRNTNMTNGPIYTIPNGHKMYEINLKKNQDIYILGSKNPQLALELKKIFVKYGFSVICHNEFTSREIVFNNMASSHISIVLPNQKENEGFFLPALEAMKYSDITIVPDCVGNRSFCFNKVNCLMPKYTQEDIVEQTMYAMQIIKNNTELINYKIERTKTLEKHTIKIERHKLYHILKIEGII